MKMGQLEKLKARIASCPRDFSYDELRTLLSQLGFREITGAGSARKFYRELDKRLISLHEPHPGRIIKVYMIRDIAKKLEEWGDLS